MNLKIINLFFFYLAFTY